MEAGIYIDACGCAHTIKTAHSTFSHPHFSPLQMDTCVHRIHPYGRWRRLRPEHRHDHNHDHHDEEKNTTFIFNCIGTARGSRGSLVQKLGSGRRSGGVFLFNIVLGKLGSRAASCRWADQSIREDVTCSPLPDLERGDVRARSHPARSSGTLFLATTVRAAVGFAVS